jgi:hypothetical protein
MMTERGIDELSRVLGGIENQLKTVTTTLAEDRIASAQYRTDIRREVGSIKDKVVALERIKDQGEGAAKLVGLAGKIVYSILAILAGLAGGYFGGHIAK